jgi:hypothetical protein
VRSDITKIINLRARIGDKEVKKYHRYKDRIAKDPENYAPSKEAIRNKLLGWDDVYSEVCKSCPVSSLAGREVREAIEYYVAIKPPKFINGVPHEWYTAYQREFDEATGKHICVAYKYWRPLAKGWRLNTLYVDEKGFLRITKLAGWVKPKPKPPTFRWLPGKKCLTFRKGHWFMLYYAPFPPKEKKQIVDWRDGKTKMVWQYPTVHDHYLGRATHFQSAQLVYGFDIYCTRFKQLNTKELRRHGLKR